MKKKLTPAAPPSYDGNMTPPRKSLDIFDPTKDKTIETVRAFTRMPQEVKTMASKQAKRDGLSFNSFVLKAVIEYLKRN